MRFAKDKVTLRSPQSALSNGAVRNEDSHR